jgi:hypothetical protein
MKRRAVAVTILVLAFGVMAGGLMAQAPASPPSMPMMGGEEKEMMGGKMMEDCQAMMAKHEGMKAEMASLDAKLDSLLAAMNAAKGNKKVDATAAVINEMAAQRKAMRDHMMAMGPQMMHHMMQHGRMEVMESMAKSMSSCPMMQSAAPDGGEQPKHH